MPRFDGRENGTTRRGLPNTLEKQSDIGGLGEGKDIEPIFINSRSIYESARLTRRDDKRVVSIQSDKYYDDSPRTEISVFIQEIRKIK